MYGAIAVAADTGDAPLTYGSASHEILPVSPFLGDEVADDNPEFGDETALGDDEDGVDDEGGVFAFPQLVQNGKSYDTNVFASNPTDETATLAGWVDFDGSGTFDADEFATAQVPAGTDKGKYKLAWPTLTGISTDFSGTTYARFRISTSVLTASDTMGAAPDGEVEDYALNVLVDSDGDEIPDSIDTDNDNDGIPDAADGVGVDTDEDGVENYLDADSDGDSIPDYVEAGENPLAPSDSDNDGTPDFLDLDSDNDGVADVDERNDDADRDGIPDVVEGDVDTDGDGIVNSLDLDSDNDTIPDAIERGTQSEIVDSDGDLIADYLDLDSDNDGITDIREANGGELDVSLVDVDNDGRVDADQLTGVNGYLDTAEAEPDSGIPIFAVVDSDGDGIRDYVDLDSDNDSVFDVLETKGVDVDSDGRLDGTIDENQDGLIDNGNSFQISGSLPDNDNDGLADFQDSDADGSGEPVSNPENDGDQGDTAGGDQGDTTGGDQGDTTGGDQGDTAGGDQGDTTGGDQGDTAGGDQGDTAGGDQDDPASGDQDSDSVIETGLSGGVGCSIYGGRSISQSGVDIVYPLMMLLCVVGLRMRRRRTASQICQS